MTRHAALVLQGGGALGAYELGAVQEIYKHGVHPDVIAGVSIGAINAAVLAGARHDPVKDLAALWKDLSMVLPRLPFRMERFLSLWGNPHFWRVRYDLYDFLAWTHFYELEPLLATLECYIDIQKINSGETKLFLGAMDVESGRLVEFCNFKFEGDPSDALTYQPTKIQYEHILASASIPPGFPMTPIEGKYYWDGGLINSMPLKPVTDYFHKYPQDGEKAIYAIQLRPIKGVRPLWMGDVFDRMTEVIYGDKGDKMDNNMKALKRVNHFIRQHNSLLPEAQRHPGRMTLMIDGKEKHYHQFNPIYITYQESTSRNSIEDAFCAADFTSHSIQARIALGRQNAKAVLERKAHPVKAGSSGPPGLPDDGSDGKGNGLRQLPVATSLDLASRSSQALHQHKRTKK